MKKLVTPRAPIKLRVQNRRGAVLVPGAKAGPALGPELIVNGRFTADIKGWLPYSPSVGSWGQGGDCMVTSPGVPSGVYQVIQTVPGKTYKLSGSVQRGVLAPNVTLRACDGPVPAAGILDLIGPGDVSGEFTAISSQTTIYMRVS